jgi:serine/threonine protein kinase
MTTESNQVTIKLATAKGNDSQAGTARLCPKCEQPNSPVQLTQTEYRCVHCSFELAHIDFAPTGNMRGIFGWLHSVNDIIHDRYQVKTVLGKGGFAATYLVDDRRLNGKHRALKEIPESLFDEHETRLLSRLNHPSIPDIIDRFIADGMIYLVLEFGGSRTLASERTRLGGRIPLDTLLPWIRQLCDVLTYLHAQNPPIVHRDLKPGNILLDDSDRIMLIDFGIAKESRVSEATRTIARAASQGFSPPEQVLGTGTDQRSDIYALAATLYAMLTGKVPLAVEKRFSGKGLVPPSQLVDGIPPAVDKAIVQALDLDADLRPQTVQAFSRMLEKVEGGAASEPASIDKTVGLKGPTIDSGAAAKDSGEASWQLVVTGIREGENVEIIKQRLAELYKTTADRFKFLEDVNDTNKKVIQKQLTYIKAENNKRILESNGLLCSIEISWQLVEMEKAEDRYTCPACGHVQKRAEGGSDICDQCGVIGSKHAEAKRRKNLIESEKRRLEALQNSVEQARKKEEEENQRQEELKNIRHQLGWREPKKLALTSSLLVLPIIIGVILTFTLSDRGAEESPPQITEDGQPPLSPAAGGDPSKPSQQTQAADVQQAVHRDLALSADSKKQAQQGHVLQALDGAKTIGDGKLRIETLGAIAAERANAGDSKASEQALSTIAEIANRANEQDSAPTPVQGTGTQVVTGAQVIIVQPESPAVRHKEDKPKISSLEYITDYYINSGDLHLLSKIADKVNDPFRHTLILNKIAQAQIEINHKKAAQATLAQSVGVAQKITDARDRVQVFSAIASLYTKLEDKEASTVFALAADSARRIIEPAERVKVLSTIAKEQATAGYKDSAKQTFAQALAVTSTIMEFSTRADTLRKVVEDQANVKNFDDALNTASRIESVYLRVTALKDIGKMQGQAGHPLAANQTFARALEASRYIDDVDQRAKVLLEINNAQLSALKKP